MNDLTWAQCHGRKAKLVYFPATPEYEPVWASADGIELICVVDYRGDRDEIWICEVRDGNEVSRHNARTIRSIVWA